MLNSIHIENIALIKSLDIEFSDSFCAFTGETGAGKSIIIDSIGVILGNRTSKELIRNGESMAKVEAMFTNLNQSSLKKCAELEIYPDEDGCLYISRTINADGKSTAKINFKAVPVSLLRELSPALINIHGQHDNQELLVRDKHKEILDRYAENAEIIADYRKTFDEYIDLKREYDAINRDENEINRRIEVLQFQINDISSLKLKIGEEEKLTQQKKHLANIEKISRNANIVYDSLYGSDSASGACDGVERAISALNALARVTDGMDSYIDKLTDIKSELYDIAEHIIALSDQSVSNPAIALDATEQRLDDINKAKRKYGADEQEILDYLDKAKKELCELEGSEKRSQELLLRMRVVGCTLKEKAQTITTSRTDSAKKLQELIEKELEYLEMSKVKFQVRITQKPFSKDGADDIEFFVRTNSGQDFSPLCKTASGGELSRIMLAIKSVIAQKDGVGTLIFDEVDTGISGKTSRRIGVSLKGISEYAQVLCVTHSAQIASLANTHFLVSKSDDGKNTFTSVKALTGQERIDETARIIAGINITESAKRAATELITNVKE